MSWREALVPVQDFLGAHLFTLGGTSVTVGSLLLAVVLLAWLLSRLVQRALIVRSELHERIWWALEDADVTIAFPQLDVHFDAEAVEAGRGAVTAPARRNAPARRSATARRMAAAPRATSAP